MRGVPKGEGNRPEEASLSLGRCSTPTGRKTTAPHSDWRNPRSGTDQQVVQKRLAALPLGAVPTRPHASIKSTGEERPRIYDLIGRRVCTVDSLNTRRGVQTLTLDLLGLSSGTYFLRLTWGLEQYIQPVTIAH